MTIINKLLSKIDESKPLPKFREATSSEKKYNYGGTTADIWVTRVNDYTIMYSDNLDVEILDEESGDMYLPVSSENPENLSDAKRLAEFAALQLVNGVPINNLKQFNLA